MEQAVPDAIRNRWPWLEHLFVKRGNDRLKRIGKATWFDFTIAIIRRSEALNGPSTSPRRACEVLLRRWVAERTCAWMIRRRRLVRDDMTRIDVSSAAILVPSAEFSSDEAPAPDFRKRV